ncbi:uncharacterized protein LOC144667463 [Oculina patagonica]
MDFKLVFAFMMLLALPFSAESGKCDLARFRGGYFEGKSGVVHTGFRAAIETINQYAISCQVKIYLTSSFRKDTGGKLSGAIVKPSKISNHFVGHAIDMNIRENGELCTSGCLRDVKKHTPGVKCFISKIRKHPTLRWGGDFTTPDVVHIDNKVNLRLRWYYDLLYKSLQTNCKHVHLD